MEEIKSLTIDYLDESIGLENQFTFMPFFMPVDKEYLTKVIKGGFAYGLFDEGKLVGKVGFLKVDDEGHEVDGMVIAPNFRGKGWGRKLMEHGLHELRKNKITSVFLFTHPENSPAVRLYLKLGFVIKEWIANKYGKGAHRLRLVKTL